ncbi:MAG: hypothetical protein ACYDG4_04720 [Desulfuromonadaceae bacterium]
MEAPEVEAPQIRNTARSQRSNERGNDMNATEQQLVTACRELGGIAGSNSGFTSYLATLLDNGSVDVLSMNVGDLLKLSREANERFNRVHSA